MRIDGLDGKPAHERLRIIRERRGLTRTVVADRIGGKTADWLKKIERGERGTPRLAVLIALAEIYGVDVAALTGDDPVVIGSLRHGSHPVVPALREAIEEPMLAPALDPMPDVARLEADLVRAWRTWHTAAAPREATGRILPELIREARRAARLWDGANRRKAATVLVGVYALAGQVLAWVADGALLRLTADRCMAAAEAADRPEALATAAWVVGNVWRGGRDEEALRLADEAAVLLDPLLENGTAEQRGLWGAVRLHAAVTCGRLGREGDALHRLDAAHGAAARLGAAYTHPWTLFGQVNADLTAVSVRVDLRQGATAVEQAGLIDADAVPSVDRRARLSLECARAYLGAGEHTAALHHLKRAADTSVESMQCHPLARNVAGQLAATAPRLIERDARGLAVRLGVLAGA
jgi:transcriptional regulator with XRE-family HTH domain